MSNRPKVKRRLIRGVSATASALSRTTPGRAYALSGPLDPTQFYPRFGPLPAVVEVRDQSGTWDAVGRTRMLKLSDGGHVIETITDTTSAAGSDSVALFAYELSEFQKLFGRLVDGARAEWEFEAVESGTRIRWTYTFFAKPARRWVVWLVVSLWWSKYMGTVLPVIAREVDHLSER